ncbi:hypothetical protein J2R76_005798 [Bradyrhizobium sp. USDA 4532]|uniref:hypothetical protein n=1 Tax=unclassified Bradyrhizobium TaxID=2631580 RepID=UPI00209FA178|nr:MULTISPECIES: hypothetical protein [unclassified Bradyrhizobium]MCP1829098.1 hypothetical protein [Bradyrhizobium sp. USDA 4545]MCP1922207.1 hypothetical protein [Bradyrhizobium sp. USDA 4532]
MNTASKPKPEEVRAKIRDDLIRRLFAVAISVGAATTLSRMQWVEHGRWPCLAEWQQLSILSAALTATVLSWDGYLFSIAERPLGSFWRFAIDILLVFIYMFLLMTSKLLVWWLFIHAFIYVLYAIWDLLTVIEWTPKYYYRESANPSIASIYSGGLRDSSDVSRGPIITLFWGIYFWALYAINIHGLIDRIFGSTVFVLIGLYLYRRDKTLRFTMIWRSALVVVTLIADAAYLRWGITDSTIWSWVGPYIGSASCDP